MARQNYASIIINVSTTTFQIVGNLASDSTNILIEICQNVLASLAFFSQQKFSQDFSAANPNSSPNSNSAPQAQSSRKRELVEKTCNYLMDNLEKQQTMTSITKAMLTNRNTLSAAFKEEVGIGVSSWLRKQRMNKAKQLLLNTELSIQEISVSVGYLDQANFSTTFKSTYEKSPVQMRRALKNSGSNN